MDPFESFQPVGSNIRGHSPMAIRPSTPPMSISVPVPSLQLGPSLQPPSSSVQSSRYIQPPQSAQSQQLNEELQPIQISQPFTYKKIEGFIDMQYNSDNSRNSVICDIIAMYLKGQKILYTEAKTVCEQRMNYLMLPAIFITSLCTILSLVLKEHSYGPTIVSSLNGFNAFLLAVISYLKLDAKSEAHRTSAYKFDKLQSQLEFTSGKSMFMTVSYENMVKILNDIEANVRDIKETNKFILPENIRIKYPKLCNMNVFAEVKRVQYTEMSLVNRLKDIMNEKSQLDISDAQNDTQNDQQPTTEKDTQNEKRKEELQTLESNLIQNIIALKDDYLMIDDMFEKEMDIQRQKLNKSCSPFAWLKT